MADEPEKSEDGGTEHPHGDGEHPKDHNSPPEELSGVDRDIAALFMEIDPDKRILNSAQDWAAEDTIITADNHEAARSAFDALNEVKRKYEAEAKKRTNPLKEAWNAAVKAWNEPVDVCNGIVEAIGAKLSVYEAAEKARIEEIEKAARAKADRDKKAREDAEAKLKAETDPQKKAELKKEVAAKSAEARESKKDQANAIADSKAAKSQMKTRTYRRAKRLPSQGKPLMAWIAKNDPEAMLAFIDAYIRKNAEKHEKAKNPMPGIEWVEEEKSV